MGKVIIASFAEKVNRELDKKSKTALTKIGMVAETYAKQLAPVDTGLLANSIAFAIGGETPNISTYMDNSGEHTGNYSGAAPNDKDGEMTLYVGTNVNYAVYQELGHHTVNGNWVPPQEFLRPAMEGHMQEYKAIIESEMKM